jgi:hypothetical protein
LTGNGRGTRLGFRAPGSGSGSGSGFRFRLRLRFRLRFPVPAPEEKDGKTTLRTHELFPSEEAFEANGGMKNALPETFGQLDELLDTLDYP